LSAGRVGVSTVAGFWASLRRRGDQVVAGCGDGAGASRRGVLFLCTELCGLTFRPTDDSKANIIGTTIFGDDVAAILLRCVPVKTASLHGENAKLHGDGTVKASICARGEHTWPGSRNIMGWRVEDEGLGVIFSRSILNLVREKMRGVTDAFLYTHRLTQDDIDGLIVHRRRREGVGGAGRLLRASPRRPHLMTALGPGFSGGTCLLELP
jgi:predicted naringenin-chalcone synthase